MNSKTRLKNGKTQKLVFSRTIKRNGKTIYPRKAKVFAYWVDVV